MTHSLTEDRLDPADPSSTQEKSIPLPGASPLAPIISPPCGPSWYCQDYDWGGCVRLQDACSDMSGLAQFGVTSVQWSRYRSFDCSREWWPHRAPRLRADLAERRCPEYTKLLWITGKYFPGGAPGGRATSSSTSSIRDRFPPSRSSRSLAVAASALAALEDA